MNDSEKVLKIMEENNGVITSSRCDQEGISRMILKYLVDHNKIVRKSRGVYAFNNVYEDEFLNLQTKYKKGIFSFSSSLFLHGYLDELPNKFEMTFPNSYNLWSVKKSNIATHQNRDELYEVGVVEIKTPYGNKVKTYSIEKTICDLIVNKDKVDIKLIKDAFKRYVNSSNKNIHTLTTLAKYMKCEDSVQNYLDILL